MNHGWNEMSGRITHAAQVRHLADGQAVLAVATNACAACGHGSACGIGRLTGRPRERLLSLPAADLQLGQTVMLELDERQLTQAALLGYLLPALLLLAGAVLGEKVGAGDTAAALGALGGLALGLLLPRLRRPLTPQLTASPTVIPQENRHV